MRILHIHSKTRDYFSLGVCSIESGSFLTANPGFQAWKLPILSKDAEMHIYEEASHTKPKLKNFFCKNFVICQNCYIFAAIN